MGNRNFAIGVLGWVAPGVVAVPLGIAKGPALDPLVFVTVLAWWGLSVLGCAVAGVAVGAGTGGAGTRSAAFPGGLAGVATSWIGAMAAAVAVELFVGWLTLGGAALLMPVPLVIGYSIGFAVGALLRPRHLP